MNTRQKRLLQIGQRYERLADKLALGDLIVPFDPCAKWNPFRNFTYAEVALLFYLAAAGNLVFD